MNNYAPYLIAGGDARYDLAFKRNTEDHKVGLKPFDIYFEIGFGIDIYLQYFKFSPELKLSTGLRNILNTDPEVGVADYVGSIERMNSYLVMLNFHFE